MMTLNEYQNNALETAVFQGRGDFTGLMYCGLGLTGEAGEVTDNLKKAWRDDDGDITPMRKDAIKAELGDVLWYIAVMAADLGITLEEVGRYNRDKLRSRQKRGVINGEGDNR